MADTYKKKLIEVAIPLEAINAASAREKSIRHGHPSTLHLWWARRPLAACRAVLFAQLVDDPSGYTDTLLEDPKIRDQAEQDLEVRLKAWQERKADAQGNVPNTPKPTLADCAADIERKRLFKIIEDLVKWENSTNEAVLEKARAEIRRSCDGEMPPVYDPFSGGGSIPLEAQRLGLPAYGSDLNPVAVMIGKAMVEIPPKFKDMPPVHPGPKARTHYRNAEGLAEDVRYYGEWMREKAWERIGHLYPQVDLPKEYGGGKATVIAWIWARTVPSPDPAFSDVQVPIASSFLLNAKKGKEVWIDPVADKRSRTIIYRIRHGGAEDDLANASEGTKAGRGANFRCLMSGAAISMSYVRAAAKNGLRCTLMAIVADTNKGRVFLPPIDEHIRLSQTIRATYRPSTKISPDRRAFTPPDYGMSEFGQLFTERQLVALETYSNLAAQARERVETDVTSADTTDESSCLHKGSICGETYSNAVSVYLAFGVSRLSDIQNTLCRWESSKTQVRNLFGRQVIPMLWDFGENNLFSDAAGDFRTSLRSITRAIERFRPGAKGHVIGHDAQTVQYPSGSVISTDPPYYDNIGYADLSDFFYCWLQPSLRSVYPELFSVLATPKADELVAAPYRHGNRDLAERYFLSGMRVAVANMARQASANYPATIYYAFKQSEIDHEGISSTGWATFLQAIIVAGYEVVGTWPMRTELANRMRASGSNALANSVVLVCRKKDADADSITRAEFIRALKQELPPAIAQLQAANIAPADMPQSAIGPGMGVFSRHKAVLEADDSPMTVKTALQLINRELDEFLGGIQGEFDADTRFALTWFEQHGMDKGEFGAANSLATARGISVDSVKHAGIVESAAGKVRILRRAELPTDWDPASDPHLTVWECCQHLIRLLEQDGEQAAATLLKKFGGDRAEAVKDLAYCLYDIAANKRKDAKEATAYNGLIAVWTDLTRLAATIHDVGGDRQTRLDF